MRFLVFLPIAVVGCSSSPSPFEPCPPDPPAIGAACANYCPSICEYPTPGCDTALSCEYLSSEGPQHGHWAAVPTATADVCSPGDNPPACPATLDAVPRGSACDSLDEGLTCNYPRATCGCLTAFRDSVFGTLTWVCVDLDAACPDTRPLLGSPCPSTPMSCDYGACLSSIAEECTPGGGWKLANPECAPPRF
ncbi:MAG TPA: hypothetical protein VGH28_10845 [Polyangiaceae bacterium]|jgi:hypothetical protein